MVVIYCVHNPILAAGLYTDSKSEVIIIDSEDELLKQLIETNIRQRGIGNTNPVKLGRCLKELERIYGVQQGRRTDLETFPNNSVKSQEDLANQFGISVDTIQNYKQLADMIPEMQDLVETGIVTPVTALFPDLFLQDYPIHLILNIIISFYPATAKKIGIPPLQIVANTAK